MKDLSKLIIKRMPIKNLTTGEVYDSVRAAAKKVGVSCAYVSKALIERYKVRDQALSRYNPVTQELINPPDGKRKQRGGNAVIDLGSGKVYKSLSEAARDAETYGNCIKRVLYTKYLLVDDTVEIGDIIVDDDGYDKMHKDRVAKLRREEIERRIATHDFWNRWNSVTLFGDEK